MKWKVKIMQLLQIYLPAQKRNYRRQPWFRDVIKSVLLEWRVKVREWWGEIQIREVANKFTSCALIVVSKIISKMSRKRPHQSEDPNPMEPLVTIPLPVPTFSKVKNKHFHFIRHTTRFVLPVNINNKNVFRT